MNSGKFLYELTDSAQTCSQKDVSSRQHYSIPAYKMYVVHYKYNLCTSMYNWLCSFLFVSHKLGHSYMKF